MTCPTAVAVRWVGALSEIGMTWISEVDVRCGREEGLETGDVALVDRSDRLGALDEKVRPKR